MRGRHQARIRDRYMARAVIALATIAFAVAGASVASADLAPPSTAPPVSKRTCVSYEVVRTRSGRVARCVAYTRETLRALSQTQGRPVRRDAARPPAGEAQTHVAAGKWPSAGSGSPPSSRTSSRTRISHATREHSQSGAAHEHSSAGSSSGIVLAIIAGGSLAAAALLACGRKRLSRWRHYDPGEAAS
jgi:hypothetical protein